MKNYVFDLYGTLADISTDENNERFKKTISKYFLSRGVEDFWDKYKTLCARADSGGFCEIDMFSVFCRILPDCDKKEAERAALYFRRKSRQKLKLYRGVKPFLRRLKRNGAKLYILSNAQSCFTLDELKKLKISKYFDGIELSSDFGQKKPSPEFFRHILDEYSLNPEDTVYTGNDYNADILGAAGVGVKAVYIKSNLSPETDDIKTAANAAVFATDEFKKLFEYLSGLLH